MIERARFWADVARHAPSGDNSQPWQVDVGTVGERVILRLELDNATKAAPSLFDCGFAASYLSLGAYARNFTLLSESEGYALVDIQENGGHFALTYAPSTRRSDFPASAEIEALIRQRTTNRLPYQKTPLTEDTRAALTRLVSQSVGNLGLSEFTGTAQSNLAGVFFALDQIRYRNARLYFEFLERLRFGSEAEQSPDGLRDTTLGVPQPSLIFLRLLRKFRRVRAMRSIFFVGFEKLMAFFGCLHLIRRSATVFVLRGGEDTPLGWFQLGLCFESLWLEITRRKLALQPLGTTLLLYRHAREPRLRESPSFSTREQATLRVLAARCKQEFGLDFDQPCIAFRVGYGPTLKNTSLRRPLSITQSTP